MAKLVSPVVARLERALRPDALAALAAIAASAFVIAYPFTQATHPPITDLPFHASTMSVLRHYPEEAWHFKEQFSLRLFTSRFWTFQALGAALALVLPIVTAAKVAAAVMLALLPAGLAVLLHGMKRSPLFAVLALPFVWNTMTHWGFLNYVGAVGLGLACVGVGLLLLERPTWRKQIALALLLFACMGTHAFRLPFALWGVIWTCVVLFPLSRRVRPVMLPLAVVLVPAAFWFRPRGATSWAGEDPPAFHAERTGEVLKWLFGGFYGTEEKALAVRSLWILGAVAAVCVASGFLERRWRRLDRKERAWALGRTAAVLGAVAPSVAAYFMLPMRVDGLAWYIYPRELLAALLMALALVPDLPRAAWLRLAVVGVVATGAGAQALYVARDWRQFERVNADFRAVTADIPQAPKLGYMVFDQSGSNRLDSPFIHLPGWVQAEKGGWLSWHSAVFSLWPIEYREAGDSVPPSTPEAFEWRPELFDVATRGRFFDWFLVRAGESPEWRFFADGTIRLARHEGKWWLFERKK